MAKINDPAVVAELDAVKTQIENLVSVHGAGIAGVQAGLIEQQEETSDLASVHGGAIATLQADMIETKGRVTDLENA